MSSWLYLSLAVVTNVSANFFFKTAMAAFPQETTLHSLLRFAFNPHLWMGALCCVVLLGSYLMALRQIELAIAYAFVISLSLVGISLLSPLILSEPLRLQALLGTALVIAGILLIVSSSKVAPRLSDAATTGEHIQRPGG
jgi:multidrug transporter EmrE-like cation transporter